MNKTLILIVPMLVALVYIVPTSTKTIYIEPTDVVTSNKPFAGWFGGTITINDTTYYGVEGGFQYAFRDQRTLIQHCNIYGVSF